MAEDSYVDDAVGVAGRFNRQTGKHEVAWIDEDDQAHIIGSYDTAIEAELAATEFVIGQLEANLVEFRAHAEVLRLGMAQASLGTVSCPKTFMPLPKWCT